jgi:hypothetical protein
VAELFEVSERKTMNQEGGNREKAREKDGSEVNGDVKS